MTIFITNEITMDDNRYNIIQNIIDITDYDNNNIPIENIRVEFSCNKYSSKKNSIYRIVLNCHKKRIKTCSTIVIYNFCISMRCNRS